MRSGAVLLVGAGGKDPACHPAAFFVHLGWVCECGCFPEVRSRAVENPGESRGAWDLPDERAAFRIGRHGVDCADGGAC